MNNKKILIRLISLLMVLCVLPIASCSKNEKRIVKVLSAGSSVWMVGSANTTYEIKELGEKTDTGVFYFTDYYVSESGTSYEILDNRGKAVSTIKLAKKSETYNPKVYEFNLDEYNESGIAITGDMNYVKIYSSNPTLPHYLTIVVDFNRTTPCDIEFENVYIDTGDFVSVFQNRSSYDMNITFSGNNTFVTGEFQGLQETYDALCQQKYNEAGEIVFTTTLAFSLYAFEVRAAEAYFENYKNGGKYRDLSNPATEAISDMLSWTKDATGAFGTMLTNTPGQDGLDGRPAFVSVGNLYFNGTGSVEINGGNGCDGTDAYSSAVGANRVKGGDGGDGGFAVVSDILIVNPNLDLTLFAGNPGTGGEGAGYSPIKGEEGATPEKIESSFSYPSFD